MNSSEHVLAVFGYYCRDEKLIFRLQGVQSWCKLSIAYCCRGRIPFYLLSPLEIIPYRCCQEKERQESLVKLGALGTELGVPSKRQYLVTGFLRKELKHLETKIGATIVVGSSASFMERACAEGFWHALIRTIHGERFV